MVKASDFDSDTRRFKSCHLSQRATALNLLNRIGNREQTCGSSERRASRSSGGTAYTTDLKSVGKSLAGSNPALSTSSEN